MSCGGPAAQRPGPSLAEVLRLGLAAGPAQAADASVADPARPAGLPHRRPWADIGIGARIAARAISCRTPAATGIVRTARGRRRTAGWSSRRRRCCRCPTSIWSSRCRTRSTR